LKNKNCKMQVGVMESWSDGELKNENMEK